MNGSAIASPGKVGYYTISRENIGPKNPGFSAFRIVPTRPNSSGTWQLALTGFELFGELFGSLADALGADGGETFKWPTRDMEVAWWRDESYFTHLGEASVSRFSIFLIF